MNILLLHNTYKERGGEDRVVDLEQALLVERGEQVSILVESNQPDVMTSRVQWFAQSVWSGKVIQRLHSLTAQSRPDIAHIHNTFFHISPSVYPALSNAGIPIVQTLHNYRWLCPAGTLYRNGERCEECVGKKVPYPAFVHSCYRDSLSASGGLAAILSVHNILNTLMTHVDLFISPSRSLRTKYIEAGFPPERIVVKPHAVPDAGGDDSRCDGPALFVGRLSEEKGLRILLSAWRHLDDLPLLIVGDGPLRGLLEETIRGRGMHNIRLLGYRKPGDIPSLMKEASMLVAPSAVAESFGLTIIEAFSSGIPVICSGHGAPAEIVNDGLTGIHCRPRDPVDLAKKVRYLSGDKSERIRLGRNGYQEFLAHYTMESNYQQLRSIYQMATNLRNERDNNTSA